MENFFFEKNNECHSKVEEVVQYLPEGMSSSSFIEMFSGKLKIIQDGK